VPCRTREEQNTYQREWVAARRAAWFKGKVCVICGGTTRLQLDHRDPSTKDKLLRALHTNNFWSWSSERRDKELVKCQVLCKSCHLQKTSKERRDSVVHGSGKMYQDGCRCNQCTEWKRQSNSKYRGR
jgi:5-methylcytosine-specific restriction endonuclease McrA